MTSSSIRPVAEATDSSKRSILALVGVPVGNSEDVTLRALRVLRNADLLLCESRKSAARLFHTWNIPFPREQWLELNEHTRPEELQQILDEVRRVPMTALISDAGMPVICDPGAELVTLARAAGVKVEVVPGPSALTAALTLLGVGGHGFHFSGYPPREKSMRRAFFQALSRQEGTTLFFETPYRIGKVLEEISLYLPDAKKVSILVDITGQGEILLTGRPRDAKGWAGKVPKGPPVFIIHSD